MKKIILLITLLFLLAIPMLAQDQVFSGLIISEETTWGGKIIIEGDVIVKENTRLTINPGTQILFRANIDKTESGKDKTRSELIVNGILIVKGKVDRKVTFSSTDKEPRMGDWYGIWLDNSKQPSIIDYAIIEYAYNGITVKKNNSLIRNSQLKLNYNAGISCEIKASPVISRNIISENGYAGLIARLGSNPVLSQNLISLNEIGIIVFGTSAPNLGNLNKGKNYNLGQNNIFENTDYDLYNHSGTQLIAENNSWGSESKLAERIYGPVDFEPLYKQQNIDDLLEIAQETSTTSLIAEINPLEAKTPIIQTSSAKAKTGNQDNKTELTPLLAVNKTPGSTPVPKTNSEKKDAEKDILKEISSTSIITENAERPLATTENTPVIPQINYDQVFLEQFLDTRKAETLKKVAPRISRVGTKGRVIVRAVVGKDGEVESASVVRGLDLNSDQVSLDAAKKFEFKPGSVKGVPVKFYTNILFIF